MNDQPPKSNIVDQIEKGQVKMKPKSLLLLQSTMQVVGTATLLLLTIYLVSYVLFQAKISGAVHLTDFGADGVLDLLLSLPKIILLLTAIFFILLIWSYEQFPVGYRRPLLFSIFGVVLIVGVAGTVVYKTPLHAYFYEELRGQHQFHLLGPLYRKPLSPKLHNGAVGQVTMLNPEFFAITSPSGQVFTVISSSQDDTTYLWPPENIALEDWVIVRGKVDDLRIKAMQVQKIPAMR